MAKTNLSSVIYAGIFFNEEERSKLMKIVPLQFSKEFAHHVTLMFKPHAAYLDAIKPMFGAEVDVTVIHNIVDHNLGVQCVSVKCDELSRLSLIETARPHITMSTEDSVSPVVSNEVLYKHEISWNTNTKDDTLKVNPAGLNLKGTIGFFTSTLNEVTSMDNMVWAQTEEGVNVS
tara:strand:- start:3879 stop:4403 length:525 start_codon:yes stop_codon:yes gene_type:complete